MNEFCGVKVPLWAVMDSEEAAVHPAGCLYSADHSSHWGACVHPTHFYPKSMLISGKSHCSQMTAAFLTSSSKYRSGPKYIHSNKVQFSCTFTEVFQFILLLQYIYLTALHLWLKFYPKHILILNIWVLKKKKVFSRGSNNDEYRQT